jgi:hypothetical protein
MDVLSYFFHPVSQYAVLAAAFAICLVLLFRARTTIGVLQENLNRAAEESKERHELLRGAIGRLEAQVRELEEQSRLSAGASVKSMVNINKRTQALRMFRAGETPQRIATALGMSRGEIDLLVRVQGIVLNSYETGNGPDGKSEHDSTFAATA